MSQLPDLEVYEEFTEWVIKRGVKINCVKAHIFNEKGVGIVAEKAIKAGSILLHVPLSALETEDTVPRYIVQALGRISVHGLLATDHLLGYFLSRTPWHAVLPTLTEFRKSIALCWPASLQEQLPPVAKKLLQKQKKKFEIDWKIASRAFPGLVFKHYLHAWLLVNTRTFYFVPPICNGPPRSRDDCMALSPYSDCFNHSSSPSASVQVTKAAINILASKNIHAGEEVTISYGNHPNDFLLVEYGFILEENPWDEVLLDAYILPLLNSSQKKELKDVNFLGNYLLDKHTACHRTQVALRIIHLPFHRWRMFVNGFDDGEKDQPQVDRVICSILTEHREDIRRNLNALSQSNDFPAERMILCRRWKQIDKLLRVAIDRLLSLSNFVAY